MYFGPSFDLKRIWSCTDAAASSTSIPCRALERVQQNSIPFSTHSVRAEKPPYREKFHHCSSLSIGKPLRHARAPHNQTLYSRLLKVPFPSRIHQRLSPQSHRHQRRLACWKPNTPFHCLRDMSFRQSQDIQHPRHYQALQTCTISQAIRRASSP